MTAPRESSTPRPSRLSKRQVASAFVLAALIDHLQELVRLRYLTEAECKAFSVCIADVMDEKEFIQ
jgi:hypothetical protein